MKSPNSTLLALAAASLAGCTATNPPLLFGESLTFGLKVGNEAASGGAGVTLGYKHDSVAVVPVSTINSDGRAYALKAHGGPKDGDALSVFAVFESSTKDPTAGSGQVVRLGQIFSTGLAAQKLTEGYQCRFAGNAACSPPPTPQPTPPLVATQDKAGANTQDKAPPPPPLEGKHPYQSPLVYLRSDVFGFDISASAAEQGGQFALGLSSRNLALIPVVAQNADGSLSNLLGNDGSARDSKDSYSVLGQFKAETNTLQFGFGLERYFATGVAAVNLSEGLMVQIARQPPPVVTTTKTALNKP